MKVTHAAVLEPAPRHRRPLITGLERAGLRVSAAQDPQGLRREQLVVLGPSLPRPKVVAAAVRQVAPKALVLLAVAKVARPPAFADGVLPLPVSPNDLRARLPELARLRAAQGAQAPRTVGGPDGGGIVDPFTGFYRFVHFKEIVFAEVKRARRYGFPVGVALIAFDPPGVEVDEALYAQLFGGLALAIRRSLRDTDYPVQYGPDRVLLLMPHTDLQGSLIVSRRICERVAKASLTHGDRVLRPTISAGVAATQAKGGELSFAEVAARAQTALEEAMAAGGNRVEFPSAADTVAQVPGSGAA